MIHPGIESGLNNAEYLNKLLIQLEETIRVCMGGVETSIRNATNSGSSAIDVALELNKNQVKNINALSDKIKNTATDILSNQKTDFDALKSEIIRNAEEITQEYQKKIEEGNTSLKTEFGETYIAKTDFEEYKNQSDTSLEQNSEAIKLNAQKTESIQSELTEYKKNNNAELSVQAEKIVSQVEATFASKTELENLEEHLSNKVIQDVKGTTEEFTKQLIDISDKVVGNEETVSTFIEELNVYIRRGELEEGVYGIEIGRSDSGIVSRFTNDRLSFIQGGVEVAYLSESNLYITRAEVLDYLKLGNSADGWFTFDVTENGLEVRWNG